MKTVILVVVAVLVLTCRAQSQDAGFGAGVLLGEPTGLSAKLWVSHRNAIDFGVAYSFRRGGYFHLHSDYLWHFPDAIQSRERFPVYVGLGGRLAAGKGSGVFGIRIPLGIAFWLRSAPIEMFLEVVPIVDLAPATEMSGNAGIGARFYFR
jgi:hypothetical protein